MPSTALDDQRFERVAPTWEVGHPDPEHPTPAGSADRGVHLTIAAAIALALVTATLVAVTIATSLAFGLPLGAGIGQRTPHPQSAADVADGFALGAGELRVDLRDVAFPAGTTRTKVDVGFGEATVIVPRGVEVVVDGEVLAGQAQTFGRAEDGLGVQTTQASGAGPRAPRLELDARVGFGQLRVERG